MRCKLLIYESKRTDTCKLYYYLSNSCSAVFIVAWIYFRFLLLWFRTKFKTACFKDGSVVIDGEAMAILPSLAVEQTNTSG